MNEKSVVLVTGGTGFIGSHLVDSLLARGCNVRCLVRSRKNLRWLAGKDLDIFQGDCTVPESLVEAVSGVDYVFHLAGILWASSRADYFHHNVAGTRNLVQACSLYCSDLKRFIHVSSQAAAGPATGSALRSEMDLPTPVTPYGESKLEAEKIVEGIKNRLSTVIVRPCAVYGPRDTGFLAYFRIVRRGFLLEFGPGGDRIVSLCHVGDIVRGIVASAHSQVASGSVYFLADSKPYTWYEVETNIEQAMGIRAKRIRVPNWLLMGLGTVGQGYGRITGKFVMLNKSRVAEMLARQWGCDTEKARRELNFSPQTNLTDGLLDVIHWYKQEQWL